MSGAFHVLLVLGVIGTFLTMAGSVGYVLSWSITREFRPPETRGERFAEHFCWSRVPFR